MNKSEFVKALAKDIKWSVAKTQRVLDAFIDLISDIIVRERKLSLFGLGVFTIKHKQSRRGRNPKTGEELILPPKEHLHFKPSGTIIGAINKR